MCLGSIDITKVRRIKKLLENSVDDLLLNHRDILCRNPASDFTRERDFNAKKTLSTLIRFGSTNAESELINILNCKNAARNINSAFLQQRKKLTDQCFPFLFQSFTEKIFKDNTLGLKDYLCHGMHLLAADGSDVNVAYNPNDPLTYVAKKNARGYNQIHLNAMYDVCTGMWMSANIQGIHRKQERRALVEMISQLKDAKKCIITADRGYESFNTFAACIEAGSKFVIRLKDIESNGIISAYDLPDSEFDVDITTILTKRRTKETLRDIDKYTVLPYYTDFDFFGGDDATYEITIRVVRFRLPNGQYVAVATNLDEEEYGKDVLREIYHRRWTCETGFRRLKHTIGLINFHSWKMQYIHQEVFARLIQYNFCAAIIAAITPFVPPIEENDCTCCESKDSSVDDVDREGNAPDGGDLPQKKTGIAFTKAVTVCRKLFIAQPKDFIRDAVNTIRAHTYETKAGRSFVRNVKPKSNKPFSYKPC